MKSQTNNDYMDIHNKDKNKKHITVWHYFHYMGGGNELIALCLYHIIITGKYYRAFNTSILISMSFTIVNLGQVIYQDPRPFWVRSDDDEKQVHGYHNIYSFGNPSNNALPAAIIMMVILRK